MVLRNELGKRLGPIPPNDEVVEDESVAAALLDDELLDALSFIEGHLKMDWNIIAVRWMEIK